MLGQRTKLCQLIRILPIQQRQQTNVAVNLVETDRSTENSGEWEQARPYSQIPRIPVPTFLRNYLPGGKYYKLEFPDALLNMIEEHGPLVRMPSVFGKPELLVTHDPKHFETILRNEGPWPERFGAEVLHHHRHEYRKEFYNGTEGIVATQGETWAKFRTSVNPVLMQPKTVRLYYKKMSNVNKEFIQRIRDIRDSNTLEVPASFEEDINRWTLESVSVVALDKQLGLIHTNRDDPQAKILFDNLTQFFELSGIIEFQPSLWRYIATPTYKKIMKVMDNIQEITVGYVNEALERLEREPSDKPESEQSVLEKLAKIDKKVATVMAMDMLMAGVDTTTTTFTGCLLCLAKNPEKQAKLREEILRILPEKDSEFTEASMKNVPYLRACIKEALRVYPLAPGNARVIKSDIVLNGYQVPKETPVLMLTHGIEKDDQHFPRSKEFLPERWLRESKEETSASKCPNSLKPSTPFAYLPFGFGPRMCIGRRIVDMELELGIARLLRNFHVEYNYSTEKAFRCSILNVPNIPLTFKFTDVEQ